MLTAKVVRAGPRGNACRKCKEKVKAPDVILRVTTRTKFSEHPKIDNFCPNCGVKKVEKALSTLKEMKETLTNGPTDDSQLERVKVRKI